MNALNATTDCEKFLQAGSLTKPFLDDKFVFDKVMADYKAKKRQGRDVTKLESLYNWIDHLTTFERNDREFVKNNKFQRTAEEIWNSKKMTGCTDYSTLFAVFARQIGVPTTILHTVALSWVEKLQSGEDYKMHYGHTFCECFYEGKWVLVDPTCRKIEREYNADKLHLDYNVGENSVFIPYFRGLDLERKQTIKEHNEKEEALCSKININ